MNPGKGVNPTRSATCLLFIFLHWTSAELSGQANGNVGCLFSDIVCQPNEVCFNDLVIGRCISASSVNQNVERIGPLEGPELGLLEAEMSRIFGLGYSWPDHYTQCVFQTLIDSIQHRLPYTQSQCGNLLTAQRLISQDSLEDIDDNDNEDGDRDTLSDDDNDNNVYIVPEEDIQSRPYRYTADDDDSEIPLVVVDYDDRDDDMTDDEQQEAWTELQNVIHKLKKPVMTEYIIIPHDEDMDYDDIDEDQILVVPVDDEDFDNYKMPTSYQLNDNDDNSLEPYMINIPDFDNQQIETNYHPVEKREANYYQSLDDDDLTEPASPYEYIVPYDPELDMVFSPDDLGPGPDVPDADLDNVYQPNKYYYNIPDAATFDDTDDVKGEYFQPRTNIRQRRNDQKTETLMDTLYPDDSANDVSSYDFDYEDSRERQPEDDDDILYYNPDNEPIEVESVFNRRERLDVKKPGPFYTNSPNNFFIDKIPSEEEDEDLEEDLGQTEYEFPMSGEARHKKGYQQPLLSYLDISAQNNDYLYINIKDRFSSLGQANKLWQYVADHLEVPKEVFSDFKPETSRIVLKVNSNPRQLNATSMAKLLDADTKLKEHSKNDLGVEIESFEVGDEKSSVMSVYSGPSQLFLLMFLLTAGIAALLLAAAVLLFIRRRNQIKSKQIQQDETKIEKEEPVKEYKQLVRDWSRSSRASQGSDALNNQSAPASAQSKGASPNKILGKTSQNSEGSRTSSTSSWQEEPGVNCMDISTGHMVLSYMEDHLKNKQRLEQEWVGLCAYEAEPNSTSIAFKVENKKKNKYPDKLPYDHNRVLLNALVNGSNSDYINASTVMDHDPRNPAYIITQGPMSHTTADFWQMVWEQGSVVIVMLSKLSENNGHQLCHRYWPEEGSEQYHIFEVHLVSEHVWCDDYLVRSLYLKNSQTGETRTVTQFHFLSWPDGNIPTSTKAILEFRRKVNKSYRGRSCPMIVHCSDGVGRSGTYVLIDMVLNRMMKGSKEIDIAATLEHIRDQRAGMVQTRSQFEFCLMAVAEETHAILKSLPQ